MLDGVRILSFTHYLQGPSTALALADLGADVVKVESCSGAYERRWSGCNTYLNGVSVFYLMTHRNQRAIAIDLKSDEGKECIYRLIEQYDVIIENFRPGVMTRLGLGYEQLKSRNPAIIYCSCTGYGSTGPSVKRTGQDLLAQGMSGLAKLSGPGDRPPVPAGTALVDQHGATLAALGVVAAVYDRSRTGNGHKIDTSLLGSALDLQIEPLNYYLNGGKFTPRATTGLSSRFHQSPYGVYETSDGYITLSLTPHDKLVKLFSPGALDRFSPSDQMEHRIEFDRTVATEMKKRSTEEWMEVFEANDIWYSPVNDYDDVVRDEQVVHNQYIYSFEYPGAGTVRLLAHVNQFDGKPVRMRSMPPRLGEHTRALLLECGYSNKRIEELAAAGKIKLGDA